MSKIEVTILKNLLSNEDYLRKVLPFIKDEYFSEKSELTVFKSIVEFVNKYNTLPTIEALEITLQKSKETEQVYKESVELLKSLSTTDKINSQWLLDETERFCKDKAVYNAIYRSIGILNDNDKVYTKDSIPSLLQEALGVSFDRSIGHDYYDDAEDRYEYYHRVEHKVPFDIEILNLITNGGLSNKTLNVLLAGTGVGKSLAMCHMAAACLAAGLDVLYITNEMAEEKIAERIDANLLNVSISQLKDLPKQTFTSRIGKLLNKTHGKLIIKEYPTSSAHAGHFNALMTELYLKKNFRPRIVFIDYLNICASVRFKPGNAVNSYTYVKAIAEELRGFAVEHNVPVVTATQTTRSGFSNTDIELTDTSESFGLPATADLMLALISTEELEQLNQIMVKQLKNRYSGMDKYKRFMLGIDKPKMRLYNLENSAQENLTDSGIDIGREVESDTSFRKPFSNRRNLSSINT
jgi:replicative DNA helicase